MKWEGAKVTLQDLMGGVCVCCPGAEGWRARSMGDPGHPARWSPGGLLLDPEDEEAEFTAPGTRRHRRGGGGAACVPAL